MIKVILDQLMLDVNMPLQGWVSNNAQFNQIYELNEERTQSKLGTMWNTVENSLLINKEENLPVEIDNCLPTKCELLPVIASVFNPLLFASLIITKGKILL